MFFGCTGLTSVSIPAGVEKIDYWAFAGCSGLSSVTIPASVTFINESAFSGCTGLTRIAFLGNAPSLGARVFESTAPGFSIYYLSSRTGFSSPTSHGFPATVINETTYPAASWLLEGGLWYDTDLHHDPDGDGVPLLTAYALGLDPPPMPERISPFLFSMPPP